MECPWQAVKKDLKIYANGLFIQMLVFEGLCGLVANFSRAEVPGWDRGTRSTRS